MADTFPHGVVHEAGADLQATLRSDPEVFQLWKGLTPLGRNEFICWVDDAKQPKTRQRRMERTVEELREGAPLLLGGLHPPDRQGAQSVATGCPDRSEAQERPLGPPP